MHLVPVHEKDLTGNFIVIAFCVDAVNRFYHRGGQIWGVAVIQENREIIPLVRLNSIISCSIVAAAPIDSSSSAGIDDSEEGSGG
jgi:hypothetical protein